MKLIPALLTIACFTAGCQNKMIDENKSLWQQNRELQAQNNDLTERLKQAPDPQALASMREEIAKRDQEIANLQANLRQPSAQAPAANGLEGIDATYDPKAGTLTVAIPGRVLFEPGVADLKSSSHPTLDKVAAAIKKNYPSKQIFVDGHTDPDPIKKHTEWKDNYDLSYARAKAVMAYLASKGIAEKHLAVRAFASNNPKGSKDESRRVEIVVAVK
jgi:chemotaxis protein MotB